MSLKITASLWGPPEFRSFKFQFKKFPFQRIHQEKFSQTFTSDVKIETNSLFEDFHDQNQNRFEVINPTKEINILRYKIDAFARETRVMKKKGKKTIEEIHDIKKEKMQRLKNILVKQIRVH